MLGMYISNHIFFPNKTRKLLWGYENEATTKTI
jgi:hypothetical protein